MRICDDPALTDANVARDSSHSEHSTTRISGVEQSSSGSPIAERIHSICLWLSQSLAIAVVCGLPWWFGGVQPPAQFVCGCIVLIAAILMCGAELLGSDRNAVAPRAMLLVLFAALALGLAQLLPLPHRVMASVAPQNASLWQQLTPINGLPTELSFDTGYWSARRAWPVSLYAASTQHDLALLCVAVGMFLVGAFQFSSDRAIRALLVTVAVGGAAFGFFGIAQQLAWNGKIFGVVELSNGGAPFAAFVNRNNAGGFLNLCLAVCLGLLVLSFRRARQPRDVEQLALTSKRSTGRQPTNDQSWREVLANVGGLQLFAVLMSVVVLGALLCSLSRGATLACLLSFGVLAIAARSFVKNRWLNVAGWTLLVLGGAGLAAWVGRVDEIQQRAVSIANEVSQPNGRWGHWRDGLAAASHFWPLGSGLGTYRFVYRLYEEMPSDAWFFHAENQYVEALVDGGWLGLGLLITAVALTATASWQLLSTGTNATDHVLGVVGLFAISTQSIHAFFDFGLYLPANMCLLALICGVVHGRYARRNRLSTANTEMSRSTQFNLIPRANFLGKAGRVSVASVTCLLLIAAVINLYGNAQVDAALRSLPAESSTPSEIGSDPQQIRACEIASLANPRDSETRLRTAEAWIRCYRHAAWKSLVALRPNDDPNMLWQFTAPAEVHAFVRTLEQSRRTVELEDFRASRAVRDNLVPAVRHLLAARAACPLLAEVHLLLSELEPIISASAGAGTGVERVRTCAPRHSHRLAEAGLVALVNSQPDLAAAMWQQAVTVEPQRLPTLLRFAASQPAMQNHLRDILPQDLTLLVRAARESFSGPEDHALQMLITKSAREILPAVNLNDADRFHLEGVLLLLENQSQAAIERLTKASEMNPLEVSWRFDLATALADSGMMEQARDHASFCTRMEPENAQYSALLKRLIRTSLTSQ